MKTPEISPIPPKSKRPDRNVPPPEIRDLLDHIAEMLAAEYQGFLTPEPESPAKPDQLREMGSDK